MEQIIKELVELAKKDRKTLSSLKKIAVNAQKFELAVELRNIELEKYPKANTKGEEYKQALLFKKACALVDLTVHTKTAYKLLALAKLFNEKHGDLDIMSTGKIISESEEIFGED